MSVTNSISVISLRLIQGILICHSAGIGFVSEKSTLQNVVYTISVSQLKLEAKTQYISVLVLKLFQLMC